MVDTAVTIVEAVVVEAVVVGTALLKSLLKISWSDNVLIFAYSIDISRFKKIL